MTDKRVACVNCRHYQPSRYMLVPRCEHPDAVLFSRIYGGYAPPLTPYFPGDLAPQKTLADCDREGRFEKRRPWWRLI